MKQWYGISGETLAEVKHFGSDRPFNYNMDFLEYTETPEEAFRKFFIRRCKELKQKLERAETLAALYPDPDVPEVTQ